MKMRIHTALFLALVSAMVTNGSAQQARIEFPEGKTPVFGWQKELLAEPKGG